MCTISPEHVDRLSSNLQGYSRFILLFRRNTFFSFLDSFCIYSLTDLEVLFIRLIAGDFPLLCKIFEKAISASGNCLLILLTAKDTSNITWFGSSLFFVTSLVPRHNYFFLHFYFVFESPKTRFTDSSIFGNSHTLWFDLSTFCNCWARRLVACKESVDAILMSVSCVIIFSSCLFTTLLVSSVLSLSVLLLPLECFKYKSELSLV